MLSVRALFSLVYLLRGAFFHIWRGNMSCNSRAGLPHILWLRRCARELAHNDRVFICALCVLSYRAVYSSSCAAPFNICHPSFCLQFDRHACFSRRVLIELTVLTLSEVRTPSEPLQMLFEDRLYRSVSSEYLY